MIRRIMSHDWNIHMKKMNISSVVQQFDTFFEDAAKTSVIELKKKIKEVKRETDNTYSQLSSLQEVEREDVNNQIPSEDEIELYSDLSNMEYELSLLEEKLLSLMEMQIISLYKNFEILQKQLISASYKESDVRDFYMWDNVKSFFNMKGFNYGRIKGYDYINQLRIVNNNIKHSSEIDSEVRDLGLPCFKDLEYYDYKSLEKFHKRVHQKVPEFLRSLSERIIKDLYEFDDERIKVIAKSYVEVMDKTTLEKLAKSIEQEAKGLPKGISFNPR